MANRSGQKYKSDKKSKDHKRSKDQEESSPLRDFRNGRYYEEEDVHYYSRPGYRTYVTEIHKTPGRYYDLSPQARYDYLRDAVTAADTEYIRGSHYSLYDKHRRYEGELGQVRPLDAHIYSSHTRIPASCPGGNYSCSRSPVRHIEPGSHLLNYRSAFDPLYRDTRGLGRSVDDFYYRPMHAEDLYQRTSFNYGHRKGFPEKDGMPDSVEISPNRYSPTKNSQMYYPSRSAAPTAKPDTRELEEARRRAAEEEAKRREEEQKRKWAEEDAEREAKRRLEAEEKLSWEEQQRALSEAEQRERDEFNRRELEKRDREREQREREYQEQRRQDRLEREQRERELEERRRKTEQMMKEKIQEDIENSNKHQRMMPQSYDLPKPDRIEAEPPKKIRATKKPKKKKRTVRRKPAPQPVYESDEEIEVKQTHKVQQVIPVNPRYEQIATALFKNQQYVPPKVRRTRVRSANPKRSHALDKVTEEEYLKVLYPEIDYSAGDIHCYKEHNNEWFHDFMRRVFEKGNQVKYDLFMQRCLKTSPYNDKGGERFTMLKDLVRYRSNSPKKNYQRNTIASLAKAI
uniref:Uncharacterized protein n=1 Tax=Euplotes crassus TaxID=5936 RepID=A0A7S3KDT6_EUPCR|mmetsp:Transcript_22612/g.22462  ORF Transcript_22612/g.22462 Transcript_22612/m.22462 type:complete len:572 (+) Transcript_22612:20-1735(+)